MSWRYGYTDKYIISIWTGNKTSQSLCEAVAFHSGIDVLWNGDKETAMDYIHILLLYLYMPKIILNIKSVEIWKISTKQLPQLPSTYVDIRIEGKTCETTHIP